MFKLEIVEEGNEVQVLPFTAETATFSGCSLAFSSKNLCSNFASMVGRGPVNFAFAILD
jgi:hypothetical protein